MVIQIPEHVCECGYSVNASNCVSGEPKIPEKGDYSICAGCGRLKVFNSDLSQRDATYEELQEAEACSHDIKRARVLILERIANGLKP